MTTPGRRFSPRHRTHRTRRSAQGVALFEVLIGMVLIAAWLLSNAGLQLGALKFQKSAEARLVAVGLSSELAERMEGNLRGANAGNYSLASTTVPVTMGSDCASVVCQPGDLATYDLAQWSARAATALALTDLSVVDITPTGGVTTYQINISWKERRGRQTYAADSRSAGERTETMSYVTSKALRNASL